MNSLKLLQNYGPLDRLLHRLAFRSGGMQTVLADMEDSMYRSAIESIPVEYPVLITALPRAGTTLLLELLYATGEFASHTYRQMPFVLCPLLWNKLSGGFRSAESKWMQRAHDDGMEISLDSAESFEEIIWRRYWPNQYQADRILPWTHCSDGEFDEFLGNHLRKILYLANPEEPSTLRYLSKNNGNIARLDCLQETFSRPLALVPFRDPAGHAASLHRQHLRFRELHRSSRFALDYMRGIGHFDFGDNLLPIDFDGWLDQPGVNEAGQVEFWLNYWIATYRNVLERQSGNTLLFDYNRLVESPAVSLGVMAEATGIRHADALVNQADRVRKTGTAQKNKENLDVDRALIAEALEVHAQLRDQSVN